MVTLAPVRLLVVGEHRLSREALTQLLREDARLEVVGQAACGASAAGEIRRLVPDVVLMDLATPGAEWASALEAARRVGARTVILSESDSEEFLIRAVASGASGYLLKDVDLEELSKAVLAAARGERLQAKEDLPPPAELSERQVEILRLVAHGLSSKEIAARLGLREKTVRNHCSRLYARIGVQDRGHAILYALRSGLVA